MLLARMEIGSAKKWAYLGEMLIAVLFALVCGFVQRASAGFFAAWGGRPGFSGGYSQPGQFG